MEPSEARRLRAEGVPITALDGSEHRLIFDVEAIAELEETFGSLGSMEDEMQGLLGGDLRNAKVFKTLLLMMRAGLQHDPTAKDVRFDSYLVNDYLAAVMKATDLAFPKDQTPTSEPAPAEVPNGATPTPTPTTDIGAFRGPTFTTLPPSDSGEVMPRSGG